MADKDTKWNAMLENKGLLQAKDVLEKYGIGSETEVSVLEQDDFRALEARGVKPLQLKQLKRWCEAGGSACAAEMLPSSSTVPPPALTSEEGVTESALTNEEGETESESARGSDDSEAEKSGEDESANDCEVIGEQETAIAHEEAGNTNGKRAATEGTESEAPTKKPKSILTAAQHTFTQKFKPPPSKVDKPRKLQVRNVTGRGASMKKNGARKGDVKPDTLKKRLEEFPTHFLKIMGGQLFCEACSRNVGSSMSAVQCHIATQVHTTKMRERQAGSLTGVKLLKCITEYKGIVSAESGGKEPAGFAVVPEKVQVVRGEFLQQMLRAGIEIKKANKIRGWLERHMAVPLLDDVKLVQQYMGPLALLEHNTLLEELKDQFIGVYHDGTTYRGEAFCIILRYVQADLTIVLRLVKLAFLAGSMNNTQISALLMHTIAHDMRITNCSVLSWMHDSASANLSSFNDTLALVYPYSDDNTCMPHTDNHVGEAFCTPVLDKFMGLYNTMICKTASASLRLFAEITGKMPRHAGKTRWWSTNDVQELSLLPNLSNGNLLRWADKMVEEEICPVIAPKMQAFLKNKEKMNKFQIEIITVVCLGKHLKAGGTALEGQAYEFMTGYDTLVSMGEELKACMSSHDLGMELAVVVEANGGTNDMSIWGGLIRGRVADVAEILLSLTTVKEVMVSINAEWWDWPGGVPAGRVKGRINRWTSKNKGREQLSIEWELGIGDDGYIPGEVKYTAPEISDLSKASTSKGKFLSDPKYAFLLEAYANGTPAPNILPKEVDMAQAAPFLLTNPDFSKTEVVKAYAHTIVAPAIDYWTRTIEVKKGAQVERMKRVRIFNPLHVLGNKISVSDIEGLKIFKLSQHPQIIPQIEVMKTEVITYQALADSIKPFVERKDDKGQDTFDMSDWWKANCAKLPAFTYVLRAVLTNSPNSCPPERLFSMFNSTFNDDQKSSYADYMQLSMQSQFNKRPLQ